MAKKKDGWMEGRTRNVRAYFTDEEHALLRRAAALKDVSVSKFVVLAAVEAAHRAVADGERPKR